MGYVQQGIIATKKKSFILIASVPSVQEIKMTCDKHVFKKACKVPGQGHCPWCDVCIHCGERPINVIEVKK